MVAVAEASAALMAVVVVVAVVAALMAVEVAGAVRLPTLITRF